MFLNLPQQNLACLVAKSRVTQSVIHLNVSSSGLYQAVGECLGEELSQTCSDQTFLIVRRLVQSTDME